MQILDTAEAAKLIGLSQSTLNKLRIRGTGPRFCKLGRRVGYDPDDLRRWVEANKRGSTSERAA
jgi:predicted DNA-binding transcriptional regulator AlpA